MTEVLANASGTGERSGSETPVDVRLVGVSKSFGEVPALRLTDLIVLRGEFFSLLGASGSGKTTTLRIIAGFEEPTTGAVYLGERDVTRTAPYERNVNTVFQDYALFPHMTVADNIGYGLRVKRRPRPEIREKVDEALELVRLTGFGSRRPSQLSGGQRQRVALARALVNRPQVLLLDEPLGALDLKLRREMQYELKRIQTDVGITFIYVTHDQEEAMSMSDRVAVMSNGQIVQIGTPTEVYEHPRDAFVAGFVGVSNVLSGMVTGLSGAMATIDVAGFDRVLVRTDVSVPVGTRITATIRPEKIRMIKLSGETPEDVSCARGRVTDVSYGGPFTRYAVRIGTVDLVVLEQNEGEGPRVNMGEEVAVVWPAEQSIVLPESGR